MLSRKIFAGGKLNRDDDYHLLPKSDWVDARNVRINSTADGSLGSFSNIKGTEDVYEIEFPNGTYVSVGSRGFDNVGKIFIFLALVEGTDSDSKIVVWDKATGAGTILVDRDNSGGIDVLNFNSSRRINHIDLVDEKYLHWAETGEVNPPRMLDITKNYGTITEKALSVIKQPPLFPVSGVQAIDDPAGLYNSLEDKAWQFKYRYVYWDNSKSSYSPASSIGNQRSRGNAAIKTFASKIFDSAIRFNFNGGGALVKGVEVIGRTGSTSDWQQVASFDFENQTYLPVYRVGISDLPTVAFVIDFTVNGNTTQLIGSYSSSKLALDGLSASFDASLLPATIKKTYISNSNGLGYMEFTPINNSTTFSMSTSTPSTTNLIQAQNAITNTNSNCLFTFTSSINLSAVDQEEANRPFSYVPLFANAQALPNGNYLTYGDYTEGFDNVDVEFTLDTTTRFINKSLYSVNMTNGVYSDTEAWVRFNFTGTFSTDSVLVYQQFDLEFPNYISSIPIFENETEADFLERFGKILANQFAAFVVVVDTGLGRVELKYPTTGGNSTRFFESVILSRNTDEWFKGGSKYKFGIVYIDDYGRFGAVNINSNNEINIPMIHNLNFAMSSEQPRMNIYSLAPSWASKYAIVATKSNAIGKFLQFTLDDPISFESGTIILRSNQITEYNQEFSASIDMGFVEGDEVVLFNDDGEVFTTTLKEINDDGNFVVYQNGITLQTINSFQVKKFEIRQRISGNDSVYYQIGLIGNISDEGYHLAPSGAGSSQDSNSPARIDILNGDTPIRNIWVDSFPGVARTSEWFELHSFSDYDATLTTPNIGTPNIVNPLEKQTRYQASVRFGGAYVVGTAINNIASFPSNSFKDFSLNYCPIQRLDIDGNRMVVGQRLRIGVAPVFESVLIDKLDNENVAISERLINDVTYYAYEAGIGDAPEAYARWGSTKYGVDKLRGLVWRLANNGITPVSITGKMNSYFIPKLKSVANEPGGFIVGGFDPTNQEYLVTMFNGESNETIIFSENSDGFTSFIDMLPTQYVTLYQDLYSFSGNFLHRNNASDTYNNFYGEQYDMSVTIVDNESPLQVKSYLSLSEVASDLFTVPEIETSLGQASNLIADDFKEPGGDFDQFEGGFFAGFLNDSNSPGGIIEGDTLKGKWIKIKLLNSNTNFVYLLGVGINQVPSLQGNI